MERKLICDTGRELLEKGLVARTWGNVSCRADGDNILISPSGLDYLKTTEADIVRYNISTGEWDGARKPSSEKGVHAAAYKMFPEVNFVVHTHQTAASAISLTGQDSFEISDEEREALGGVAFAGYGLPGTEKLRSAVAEAMKTGAHTVFMKAHGVCVCGVSHDEVMERIALLEKACKRNLKLDLSEVEPADDAYIAEISEKLSAEFPHFGITSKPECLAWAVKVKSLPAQLDDMAQMLGVSVPGTPFDIEYAIKLLKRNAAVFMPGVGAVVRADDGDDVDALKLLVEKACVSALHTGAKGRLNIFDALLMRRVYLTKYSKQKG